MKIYLSLYLLYSVLTCTFCLITKINDICDNYKNLFKEPITNPQSGNFSHLVLVGHLNEETNASYLKCGGTIISKKYVLIPALCKGEHLFKANFVRVGVDITPSMVIQRGVQRNYKIADIKVHPNYDKGKTINNIALVELEKELEFSSTVRPACLDTKDVSTDNLILVEWRNDEEHIKMVLDKFVVNSFRHEDCNSQYLVKKNKTVGDGEMCVLNNCTGGLSGPLQVPNGNVYTVIALPSYRLSCFSHMEFPIVYTKIYNHLQWIADIVWS